MPDTNTPIYQLPFHLHRLLTVTSPPSNEQTRSILRGHSKGASKTTQHLMAEEHHTWTNSISPTKHTPSHLKHRLTEV
ncbi:hypothetical protein M440DRAFT_1403877, partial [Trichoderma longibrachiatum ATCC 18648]